MAYNKKKYLQENILAIHTAFELQKSGQEPTEDQLAVLTCFSGFGGLNFIRKPCADSWDRDNWNKSEQALFEDTVLLHQVIKGHCGDDKKYKLFMDSLKHSTLSAFYTPVEVTDAIAQGLQSTGIAVKRILDPSAGIGAFVQSFGIFKGEITCFEKDLLTGMVLQPLHPESTIYRQGFETIDSDYTGTFDLITSNIPFGDYNVYDPEFTDSKDKIRHKSCKRIHNYFFLKAVDMAREGGIIAFITSSRLMDTPGNKEVRQWLMERCNLVSAIRLPNNLFKEIANTEVGSDLIVLQKDTQKKTLKDWESAFTESRMLSIGCPVNNYHMDFSRVIHSRLEVGSDQYGKPGINFYFDPDIAVLTHLLQKWLEEDCRKNMNPDLYMKNIPGKDMANDIPIDESPESEPLVSLYDLFGIPEEERTQTISKHIPAGQKEDISIQISDIEDPFKKLKNSKAARVYKSQIESFYVEGTLLQDQGQIGYFSLKKEKKKNEEVIVYYFNPIEITYAQSLRVRDYLLLRDAYFRLFQYEYERECESAHLRDVLNKQYDAFCTRHGDLNDKENYRLIILDKIGQDVLVLESYQNGHKQTADIFREPVSFRNKDKLVTGRTDEALASSLNTYGYPELFHMSSVSNKTQEELLEELNDVLYYNPLLGRYEISAHFISGDVLVKSEEIEQYILANPGASDIEASKKSLEILKEAIPEPVPFSDLLLNLGERWVLADIYNSFASDIFSTKVQIDYFADLDNFNIKAESESTVPITEKYAVNPVDSDKLNGLKLFSHALLNTVPKITRGTRRYNENGKEIRVADPEAIHQANLKIDEIRAAYSDWLQGCPLRDKERLTALYNRKFNSRVIPKYDGKFQTFPDLQLKTLKIERPYASQYDTVWMLKSNMGGIVDHEVGSGKTLTICMAAHEMKRLKMIDKPLIIGKKGNIFEIAATYAKVYPNDKILYPSEKDFEPRNRKRLFNRIKNNNWDVIIMTHDQFIKIPQSLEVQFDIFQKELDSVVENLRVAERLSGKSASNAMLKGLEKRQTNLEAALKELYRRMEKRRDEDIVDFKTMGIDHIYIDESHVFKNLRFDTRCRNVAGLGDPKGSQRALNLLFAIRTIQDKFDRDLCATFLSGTTISNSLVELYLIFKYLRPRALEAQGIRTFDAWAAVYAMKASDYEFTVTGEIKSKERFRYFKNVPELAKFYNEICDYRTAKDVNIIRPENNVILYTVKQTPEQQEFKQNLIDFARTGEGKYIGRPEKDYTDARSGRMLVVTDLARKAAIDMRLIDPEKYHDHPDNKISQAAQKISEYYYRYKEQCGTQFVFADIGTFKLDKWNVYSELKKKLVEQYHLPAYEIRFIQEASSMHQREQMIADFRTGKIRVLIGHTESLGTGVDAPQKCVTIHNLSMPWTPKDLDQRGGRGARKGNEVARMFADNKVDNYMYAGEGSLDTYMFNLLQNKQTFIMQLKTNSLGTRIIDEGAIDGDGNMNYSEFVAILSGNSDLLDKAKLERKVMALESEFRNHNKQVETTRWKINYINGEIQKDRDKLQRIEEDWKYINENLPADADGLRSNPIILDNFEYNDDKNAIGLELVKMNKYKDTCGHYVKIGSLLKFDILIKTEKGFESSFNRFYIQGACKYTYNSGHLADTPELAVTNFIRAFNKIPDLILKMVSDITEQEKNIPAMEEIADTPWRKEPELRRMKIELSALERKIQDDLKEIEKQKEEVLTVSEEVEVVMS